MKKELKYQPPTITKLDLMKPLTTEDIIKKYSHQTKFLEGMGLAIKSLPNQEVGMLIMNYIARGTDNKYNPLESLRKKIREELNQE